MRVSYCVWFNYFSMFKSSTHRIEQVVLRDTQYGCSSHLSCRSVDNKGNLARPRYRSDVMYRELNIVATCRPFSCTAAFHHRFFCSLIQPRKCPARQQVSYLLLIAAAPIESCILLERIFFSVLKVDVSVTCFPRMPCARTFSQGIKRKLYCQAFTKRNLTRLCWQVCWFACS